MLRRSGGILLFLLVLGCQSREILPKRTGQEYVPVRVGAFWEYAVTETIISAVNGQTNTLYDLRLEIKDSVVAAGETTYLVERTTRAQGTSDWQPAETWSARVNLFQFIQQEGNVPYIKLQFPLSEGKAWNGNAMNAEGGADPCGDGTYACDTYRVTGLGQPFEFPGEWLYDDTVTIVENEEDDPIVSKDTRQAVYAKDIGLVYREETHLEYCTVGTCIGQQVVENGTIFKLVLTTYGHE